MASTMDLYLTSNSVTHSKTFNPKNIYIKGQDPQKLSTQEKLAIISALGLLKKK